MSEYPVTPGTPELTEQEIIRRQKLQVLLDAGQNPFEITHFPVSHRSTELVRNFDALDGQTVTIAGRMISRRVMGKASFAHLLDGEGEIMPQDADGQISAEDLAFSNPQFNWLPEGYAVENVNVEPEYKDVSCNITNDATGDSIFVDISQSYNDGEITHYIINADGSYEVIDGVILNQEVSADYSYYSMDDGSINISVFPSNPDVTAEDIIHMLTELTF